MANERICTCKIVEIFSPLCLGVTVEPHKRQLHLTLAHQYLPEHHSPLEELARSKVDPQAPARWELRLYSRDHRLASSEVRLSL